MTRSIDFTDHHAKLFSHQLLRRHSANSSEKLAGTLVDAKVDLNPHQVEAALFAFKSPLSKGAILADEVGLGKTIEAGLLLSQKWSEGKRKIIIIGPANLRKQWSQEIEEKFYLPTLILEATNYKRLANAGAINPFDQDKIVICSYQFAAKHAERLLTIPWHLAVIDEAHRMRNVYKTGNKTAKAIKAALAERPKVLLTATPLQNSLMELYGLVSIVDEHTFGDRKSFSSQFLRLSGRGAFDELKDRLAPVCHRTLRRQVTEYINYTKRIPITHPFSPSDTEQALYEGVSAYLQKPALYALPNAQRKLMTLVLRKLLASSTFAIASALKSLSDRLRRELKDDSDLRQNLEPVDDDQPNAQANTQDSWPDIADDFDGFHETREEWIDDEVDPDLLSDDDVTAIEQEIDELDHFRTLAENITDNAKGKALLTALDQGFAKAKELGAAQKVIIFTESRKTQDYLVALLSANGHEGDLVLFNGSNADPQSKAIYQYWVAEQAGTDKVTGSRSADMRAALVDHFRNNAKIMIATEAAAEGINLQFCSMLVNYDLPWNPQRLEQRIGRCHRYGQKHDVVVINFLNQKNEADQRVHQLLGEKFQLFDGVFGASDEVLGSIGSGVDFERRIAQIYQQCRTPQEIQSAFTALQTDMAFQIDEAMQDTRKKLLENFDADVHERLKVNLAEATEYRSKYERMLWAVTKHELHGKAKFDERNHFEFHLDQSPNELPDQLRVPTGQYYLGQSALDGHRYRLGHPLAQALLGQAKARQCPPAHLVFDYGASQAKSAALEPFVGKSGVLSVDLVSVESVDAQDHILFAGLCDDGAELPADIALRLFNLPVASQTPTTLELPQALTQTTARRQNELLVTLEEQKSKWLGEESAKLDKWADDQVKGAEKELDDAKARIRELQRLTRNPETSSDKQSSIQKEIQDLEKSKRRLRQRIFEVEDDIMARRDTMITEIEERLKQQVTSELLFAIRWTIQG